MGSCPAQKVCHEGRESSWRTPDGGYPHPSFSRHSIPAEISKQKTRLEQTKDCRPPRRDQEIVLPKIVAGSSPIWFQMAQGELQKEIIQTGKAVSTDSKCNLYLARSVKVAGHIFHPLTGASKEG